MELLKRDSTRLKGPDIGILIGIREKGSLEAPPALAKLALPPKYGCYKKSIIEERCSGSAWMWMT
jgi:hypothetical protein